MADIDVGTEPLLRQLMPQDTVFRVNGSAMQLLIASDLYIDPQKYDGGTDSAHEARAALRRARRKASGASESWVVRTTRMGAIVIAEQCELLREVRKSARGGRFGRENNALWRVIKGIDGELGERTAERP